MTAALAAASPGDEIRVAAGTYSPSVNGETFPLILDKGEIRLVGAGRGLSVLDAEGTAGVVVHNAALGGVIRGFTVTGGMSASGGGGIWIQAGDPEIADNTLIANAAPIRGAAMLVSGTSAPWIHHNVIWENLDSDSTDALDPHGIGYLDGGAGLVEHNVIGRTEGNGLITTMNSAPTVRNNVFIENGRSTPTPRGRGICWLSSVPPLVFHNLFHGNRIAALLWPGGGGDLSGTAANAVSPTDLVYGNLEVDPRFVDPTSLDLHLQPGSPAIDAGDPASPPDPDGTPADIGAFYFPDVTGVGGDGGGSASFLGAFPNPFSETTEVRFRLPGSDRARVAVFDVAGRRVLELFDGIAPEGMMRLRWDGATARGARAVPGIYFIVLETGGTTRTARTVLVH